MIRTTATLLIAAGLLASTAGAEERPDAAHTKTHPIWRLDTNGDGEITREEAKTQQSAMLSDADTNGDNALSRDEVTAAAIARATQRADALFDRLDSNSDGSISQDELAARQAKRAKRMDRMFNRADTDGDGVLSAEEIARMPDRGHGWRHSKAAKRHDKTDDRG